MADKTMFYGTGRRKESVARVRLVPGTGKVVINGRDIDDYFGLETLKVIVRQPLNATSTIGKFDVLCPRARPSAQEEYVCLYQCVLCKKYARWEEERSLPLTFKRD